MSETFDITQHAGAGLEELDQGTRMPQLKIVQDMSPQKNKNKDEYIEGCEVGDIFFASTNEIVPQPVTLVPVRMKALYAEWSPRSVGDGLIALHDLDVTTRPEYEKGREKKYDEWLGSNELHMTHYWFFLAEINGEFTEVVLPMSKSQLKTSRKLQEDIRKFRYTGDHAKVVPPLFARTFKLTAEYEENANGDGYYNWKLAAPEVLDFTTDGALLNRASDAFKAAQAALPQADKPKALPSGDAIDANAEEIF